MARLEPTRNKFLCRRAKITSTGTARIYRLRRGGGSRSAIGWPRSGPTNLGHWYKGRALRRCDAPPRADLLHRLAIVSRIRRLAVGYPRDALAHWIAHLEDAPSGRHIHRAVAKTALAHLHVPRPSCLTSLPLSLI